MADRLIVTAESAGKEYRADGRRVWRVGTLEYTRGSLGRVFFWMLWGDFCLNLMDSGVIANVVPLQMKKYGASGFEIGLVTGTVMEILATAMVAVISTWSDRHRGKLGRRMPFILWSTPPLAVFLGLLGFSPELAGWMKGHFPMVMAGVSLGGLTLGTMTVLMVLYKVCDNFPQSVYYYLWPDIIPARLMGTFACWFRVVATMGVMLFNLTLMKHAEDRPGLICGLSAGLYLVSFLMLVFMVKEGEYEEGSVVRVQGSGGEEGSVIRGQGSGGEEGWVGRVWANVGRYVRECYSHAYYWKIYLFNVSFICGFVPFRTFLIFYARDTMHIGLEKFGRVMAVRDGVQIVVFLLLGPIVDRFHPIRAGVAANVLAFVACLLGMLFTRGEVSFVILAVGIYGAVAIFQASTAALGPRILPTRQYGQFCSANAVIFHLGLMVALPVSGWVFDRLGYRYVYAWFTGWTLISSVMIVLLYIDWKKLGGDEGYVAPEVEEEC